MAARTRKSCRTGNIVVISAPSGSGKTTLVKSLLAAFPDVTFSVSHTTRGPRKGEKNGRDYFFVTPAKFRKMVSAGAFVEWADVYGHFYGTSWKQLRAPQTAGKDVLLDIDVQGHKQVREKLPEALSVFILPPSFRELKRRLTDRHSDARQEITRRLATAAKEIRRWREYDYLVVNNRVEDAAAALQAIVLAARSRRETQAAAVEKICKTFGGK